MAPRPAALLLVLIVAVSSLCVATASYYTNPFGDLEHFYPYHYYGYGVAKKKQEKKEHKREHHGSGGSNYYGHYGYRGNSYNNYH